MFRTTFTICLFYAVFSSFLVSGDVNGGYHCAACTIAVGLVGQLAIVHDQTIDETVGHICDFVPSGVYKKACSEVIDNFGPLLITLLYTQLTPDEVCEKLNFCYTESKEPQCHLFPLPKKRESTTEQANKLKAIVKHFKEKHRIPEYPNVCKLPLVKIVCNILNATYNVHTTSVDLDGDGYSSSVEGFRGYDWKGRDCNDLYKRIHPGAGTVDTDVVFDGNCNGIYGRHKSGTPYEDLFCKSSGARGIVVLGDSASAHFHIPEQWLRADLLTPEILETLPFIVANEFDWPHMSAITGFRNVTWSVVDGPVDSIYLRMRELNRCNHRDYQNLCVNGANSFNILTYAKDMVRNQTLDNPVFASVALVGNDVCNHHPDTLQHMTTPKQMEENILKLLQYMDTQLPKNSHIMLTGLADGRVLYDNLHNRFHPFGKLMEDITYPQFYEFIKCLQITPCAGWMTTNETLRNLTSQRAADLSRAIQKVVKEHSFQHFSTSYIECPLMQVIVEWEKKHGKGTVYQLIEPMDGFHPNQYAQVGIASVVWRHLEKNYPEIIGQRNPYNEQIKDIFGDQGGH